MPGQEADQNQFPDWEALYQETDPATMPWYFRELEPEVKEAPAPAGEQETTSFQPGQDKIFIRGLF